MTTLNLVQHRGEPTIWDQCARGTWDRERWMAAALATVCLAQGFRLRSGAGLLLTMAGSGLAWWAAAGSDERQVRRGRVRARLPHRHRPEDIVTAAGEESFPASDAPSFTPTTGNSGLCGDGDAGPR